MNTSPSNSTAYSNFKKLHEQDKPFLLANVWDAHSAKIAENAGFKAIGTSSHAIANSMGYEDGEEISFEEMFFVVEHIIRAVNIPVSVDLESGYSDDSQQVAQNVKRLTDLGVAGINLEDGTVKEGKRFLDDAEKLAQKISAIKSECEIFINARADTYVTEHPEALEESIRRAQIYAEAGADGIFIPLMKSEAEIHVFTKKVELPLNVFINAKLADYEKLGEWGVKRISHGAKQYELLMKKSEEIFKEFIQSKDYKTILGN